MCVLTPSDETLLQLCIRVHFCVRGCLSMATCESVCVCAYSVSCPLRFHTLIASSRNRQQHLSLFSALAVSKGLQPCLVSSLLYIFKQIYWARLWRPLYFIPRLFREGQGNIWILYHHRMRPCIFYLCILTVLLLLLTFTFWGFIYNPTTWLLIDIEDFVYRSKHLVLLWRFHNFSQDVYML